MKAEGRDVPRPLKLWCKPADNGQAAGALAAGTTVISAERGEEGR